jgi:hypothetical protein
MTSREHLLILALLTRQSQLSKIIADVLKSRDIMTPEDWRAFEFAASVDVPAKSSLFETEKAKYIELAGHLGIQTGLENLPPTSLSSAG